jgi:Spy/CpxP family protein refolding chaperone
MNSRIRALLVLVAVYLLGGISGFFVRKFAEPKPPWEHDDKLEWIESLNLTSKQDAKFKEIMSPSSDLEQQMNRLLEDQHREMHKIEKQVEPQYEAVWAKYEPQFAALRKEWNHRLMGVLNENQKKKFAEIIKDFEERYRHRPAGSDRR